MKGESPEVTPQVRGTDWIDTLSDEQCMEIFWLYVDPPEPFLAAHPPALLGQAMRYALRQIVASAAGATPSAASRSARSRPTPG